MRRFSRVRPAGKSTEWILSLLHSLIREVEENYEKLQATRAGRLSGISSTKTLSNWYVRLNRKRYWGGESIRQTLNLPDPVHLPGDRGTAGGSHARFTWTSCSTTSTG
ncbi:MAG: class I tRNA ligase family protein [Bacteroidales bacterium]